MQISGFGPNSLSCQVPQFIPNKESPDNELVFLQADCR